MISRRTNNRCDGKFRAKFNCKYRSVIVTDKTTILTLKNETKTRKVLPLCPCKNPIFYLHSKQDFFFFFKKYATWRCMKSTKEKLWKKWMKLPHAVISWLVKKQVHQKFTYKQSIINLILLKIISTDPPNKFPIVSWRFNTIHF